MRTRKLAWGGWEDLYTGDNESFAKELGDGYDAFLQTDFQGGMPYDYNKYEDNAEWIFWVTTPNREWLAEPEYLGSMTFEDACLAADFMIEAYEDAIAEDSMRFAGKKRKKAWRDWITINDLDGKWDSGFEEAIIHIPIEGYDHASLVDVGDAYSLTLYGNGGGSIGLGWFNTTQEAIDRLNSYLNNLYYDDGERLPDYNVYLTDPEDLKRQRGAARKYAYTDEQLERAREYFFGYEGQAEWELQFTIDEVWDALKIGLELAGGDMSRDSEWAYMSYSNGISADSVEMNRYNDGYYEEFIEGMNYGKPFYDALPEFFPNSGMWCDPVIADAFNAHMPELLEKWKLTYDAVNAYYDAYCDYDNGDTDDYPDELESKMYDVWYEYALAHENALNDMCAAAEKELDNSADYYYSDEAFKEWLNSYTEEEILDMVGGY